MDFVGGDCLFFRGLLAYSSTYVVFCEGAAAPAAKPFRRFYLLLKSRRASSIQQQQLRGSADPSSTGWGDRAFLHAWTSVILQLLHGLQGPAGSTGGVASTVCSSTSMHQQARLAAASLQRGWNKITTSHGVFT